MYAGFLISFEVDNTVMAETFVIPAIMNEAICDLIKREDAGNDEFIVRVKFCQQDNRPLYALGTKGE